MISLKYFLSLKFISDCVWYEVIIKIHFSSHEETDLLPFIEYTSRVPTALYYFFLVLIKLLKIIILKDQLNENRVYMDH